MPACALRRLPVVAIALGFALQGCASIQSTDGVTYHLVVGLGVIRTKMDEESSVLATDSRSFGVVVSDRPGLKLGVGYASSTVVSVPDGARDVLVEVSRRPFGPLVIEAPASDVCPDALPQLESQIERGEVSP